MRHRKPLLPDHQIPPATTKRQRRRKGNNQSAFGKEMHALSAVRAIGLVILCVIIVFVCMSTVTNKGDSSQHSPPVGEKVARVNLGKGGGIDKEELKKSLLRSEAVGKRLRGMAPNKVNNEANKLSLFGNTSPQKTEGQIDKIHEALIGANEAFAQKNEQLQPQGDKIIITNEEREQKEQILISSKGEKFVCPDGKEGIFNDDYCDCSDGSDEPGTSACSNLLIQKKTFKCADGSKDLYPSRVGDGIRDCNDGSDEDMMT